VHTHLITVKSHMKKALSRTCARQRSSCWPRIRTASLETESPFPGNGFSGLEISGAQICPWCALNASETGRRHTYPPTAGYSRVSRKSPQNSDCLVVPRGLELRASHAVISNWSLKKRELLSSWDSNQSPVRPLESRQAPAEQRDALGIDLPARSEIGGAI